MTRWVRLALLICALGSQSALAVGVGIDTLGQLELRFIQASTVTTHAGAPLLAEVSYIEGEAFALAAPRPVQQIRYLVAIGQPVTKGEPIAILRGPQMHHFLTEYETTAAMLASAQRRFDSHRSLYEKKAIKEALWIEVSTSYYALMLEYEHLRHFKDLVIEVADEDAIQLVAPVAGIVDYAPARAGIAAGDEIARFIPSGSLRLQVQVATGERQSLDSLRTDSCEVAVSWTAGVATGFFVPAWSEPLSASCNLIPGQQVRVTPLYRMVGEAVPDSAVFELDGRSHVLVRKGQQLVAVPVSILAADAAGYVVSATEPLAGRDILVSSVSAVQGILLGLGGE